MERIKEISPGNLIGRLRPLPERRVHKATHLHAGGLKGKLKIVRNPLVPRATRGK